MSETVRIKGEGPLDISACPEVCSGIGSSGAEVVMRLMGVRYDRATVPPHELVPAAIVEARVQSTAVHPYVDVRDVPTFFRFRLSFLEATRLGLFPADRVEVVWE